MDGRASRCRLAISLLLVALLALQASCSSWQQTKALSEPVARQEHYTRMRAHLVGGSIVTLRDPWFGGDTLYGKREKHPPLSTTPQIYGRPEAHPQEVGTQQQASDSAAIPIAQIAKLEARQISTGKTVACIVGVGVTLAAVAAIIGYSAYTGNCPRIESWDGTAWWLDSGTFAGAMMPALARTDVDNLDHAQAIDGIVRLRVTGTSGETEHVDAIWLLVVDHDPQCTVAPDGAGALHALGALREPTQACDFKRRDVLRLVQANDARNWESAPTGRDPTRTEDIRDGLELEFPRPAGVSEARLVVDGRYTLWANHMMTEYIQLHGPDSDAWYGALTTEPERAHALATAIERETFLAVSVWDGRHWKRQGWVPGAGQEIAKRQVVRLDLPPGEGETVRVRLESAPSFWLVDRVAIDFGPERAFAAREVALTDARDRQGSDIRPLLYRADDNDYVMQSDDTAELRFAVEPVPPGRARNYLAMTTGWYHMETPESGEPDWALAEQLVREPRAMSRRSVTRMNIALQSMVATGR
jgi:hypothetical protein